MEKLSVEEKARAYDEALRKAKEALDSLGDNYICNHLTKDDIREMYANFFPELIETEDERIRQELISLFRDCSNGRNHPYNSSDSKRWLAWLEKQGEKGTNGNEREIPNSSWSEEDEMRFNNIFTLLEELPLSQNWLKSLKDRVKPQPKQEWSEEDERSLQIVFDILDKEEHKGNLSHADLKTCVRKLKSLRPQSRWKPSDLQMKTLDYVVNLMASSEIPVENVHYYNQLKELKKQLEKL